MVEPVPSLLRIGTNPYDFDILGVPGDDVHDSGCPEAVTYDSNIVLDTGFESAVTVYSTGGPNGNEIPWAGGHGSWSTTHRFSYPSESTGATTNPGYEIAFWQDYTASSSQPLWKIETANPRSGTYHARIVTDTFGNGGAWDLYIAGTIQDPCGGPLDDLNLGTLAPVAGRVSSGDTVTFTGYAENVDNGTTGYFLTLECQFFDSTGGSLGTQVDSDTGGVPTSYGQVTMAVTAPASAFYFTARVNQSGTLVGPGITVPNNLDLDDFSIVVT